MTAPLHGQLVTLKFGGQKSLGRPKGGGNGGSAAERGFQQSGSCKHAVSVEATACPACRWSRKVAGVGDDFGPSSAVDAHGQDAQMVYNT